VTTLLLTPSAPEEGRENDGKGTATGPPRPPGLGKLRDPYRYAERLADMCGRKDFRPWAGLRPRADMLSECTGNERFEQFANADG